MCQALIILRLTRLFRRSLQDLKGRRPTTTFLGSTQVVKVNRLTAIIKWRLWTKVDLIRIWWSRHATTILCGPLTILSNSSKQSRLKQQPMNVSNTIMASLEEITKRTYIYLISRHLPIPQILVLCISNNMEAAKVRSNPQPWAMDAILKAAEVCLTVQALQPLASTRAVSI